MARNPASTPTPLLPPADDSRRSDATMLGRPTRSRRRRRQRPLWTRFGPATRVAAAGRNRHCAVRHHPHPFRSGCRPATPASLPDRAAARLEAFLDHAARGHGLRTIARCRSGRSASATDCASSPGGKPRRTACGSPSKSAPRHSCATLGSHLDRVANARHFAEEWDLDIALDLRRRGSRRVGGRGGADAAVPAPRAGPDRPFHTPEGFHAAGSRASIALRTVRMLADQAFVRARQCASRRAGVAVGVMGAAPRARTLPSPPARKFSPRTIG